MLSWNTFGLLLGALTLSAPPVNGYWMEDVLHQGIVPGNTNSSYQIFRNVKDFGALGNGVDDDTEAIKRAMTDGNRCAPFECAGGTTTPAVIYFPPGTYMISSTITDYFYTQIIGDPTDRPVLKASADFPPDDGAGSTGGFGLLDGIPYGADGLAWKGVNSFFRQVRNIEIDISGVPGKALGIHWPTAQATSIQNVAIRMAPKEDGLEHTGIFIEDGSGGFMADLELIGGSIGMQLGNQQFTMRNLQFKGCSTAINQIWDWTWTYQNIKVEDCDVGIAIDGENATSPVGSVLVLDSEFKNTPIGVKTPRVPELMDPAAAGSLVISDTVFENCETIVMGPEEEVLVPGSASGVAVNFAQGHVWDPTSGYQDYTGDNETYFPRLEKLEDGSGRYYAKSKPHYEALSASDFMSARTFGCAGDGEADDTECIQKLIRTSIKKGKVVFLDAGHYKVLSTIYVPAGARLVGEGLSSVILGVGEFFSDMSTPKPVIKVGKKGEQGRVEWSDTLIATRGGTAGAKMIEYNLYSPGPPCGSGEPSGLWDVHVRVGGFAGSDLQIEQCAITPDIVADESNINPNCIAGFMSMHVTESAGGLYSENCWLWIADHDIESPTNAQITIFVGRGLLVESKHGRIWIVGSGSEHHTLYNYQLSHTHDVWMGLIQSETPYYQPNPPAYLPFPPVHVINDPDFEAACGTKSGEYGPDNAPCAMAWGLRILNSQNIGIFGTGLYSFFSNNDDQTCKAQGVDWCQESMVEIVDEEGFPATENLIIYNFNTLGSVAMMTRYGDDDILPTSEHQESYNAGVAIYLHDE